MMNVRNLAGGMALSLLGSVACAQGTFSCTNVRVPNGLVTDCAGQPVGGPNYRMEVRVSNPRTQAFDAGVLQVTTTTNQPLGHVTIFSGKNAGRFSAGTLLVPFLPPGTDATVELRAWDRTTGETFDAATIRGASVAKVRLGGAGQPPSMPGVITQFSGVRLCPVKP